MPSLPSLLGPYRLDRKLGGGGFADVYLAFDTRRGHAVALKVLHPQHANSPEALRRFQREGEQMLRLRHQHIVGAYDVGVVAGYHTIAMPYLSGGSLADLLARQKRLGLSTAAAITGQVAAALDFVHPQVIHRDLKPSNVLLDGQGNCLVADFGVAHVAGESTLTPAGYQPGTPHYMAPEQVRPGMGKVGPATDVWALGVILYEMVCGQRPFEAEDSQAVMFQAVNDSPPRVLALNPALPAELEAILGRALAKEPLQRYQRAGDLGRDVARVAGIGGARMATPPPAPSAQTKLRVAARQSPPIPGGAAADGRLRVPALATAVVVIIAILALALLLMRPPPGGETGSGAKTKTAAVEVAAITGTATVTAAGVVTPTSTLAPTNVPTVILTLTDTLTPTATVRTPTSTRRPTSTLAVSTPPTATPAPIATPRPSGATRTPVRATAPPPAQPLPAPLLSQPALGHTADQGSVRFVWQAVPGAAGYRVETRSDRDGQQEWMSWSTGESVELFLNFDDVAIAQYFSIPGTSYEWRVVAMDKAGRLGAYSELRRFEFNRPTPVPPTPTPVPPTPTPQPPEEADIS